MCEHCHNHADNQADNRDGFTLQLTLGLIDPNYDLAPTWSQPRIFPPRVAPLRDLIACAECGNESRNTTEHDGGVFCEDCFDELFFACDDCGDIFSRNEEHIPEDGDACYCESCYDERYTRCFNCDCELETNSDDCNSDPFTNHRYWCNDCYSEEFTCCEDCGDTIRNDEAHYSDYTCRCGECARNNSDDGDGPDLCGLPFYGNGVSANTGGSTRSYGVELETHKCPDYQDFTGKTHFDAKYDGSICGKEFVSKVLSGDKGLSAIRDFCEKANEYDFEVNKDCGFHLHVSASNFTGPQRRKVCLAYKAFERLWQSFVYASRRENHYCKPIRWSAEDVPNGNDFADWAGRQDRYQWFNVSAFAKHETFEIRLHTATLEGDKVCNWVRAHIAFMEYTAKRTPATIAKYAKLDIKAQWRVLKRIFRIAGMGDLCEFYANRARKFKTELEATEATESLAVA